MPKVGYRSAVAIPTRAVWPARRRSAARMSGSGEGGRGDAHGDVGRRDGMGLASASSFWSAVGFFLIARPSVPPPWRGPRGAGDGGLRGGVDAEGAGEVDPTRSRSRSASGQLEDLLLAREILLPRSSCIWSARTPMYARATSAMSVTRTSRWSSSVASYVASSASICRATRPKTSSPSSRRRRWTTPSGLEAREEVVLGARSAADADGRYRLAFAKPRRARASLTLETAILRSLLPSSARAMIEVSIGSSKTVHHSRMSASSELNAGSSIGGLRQRAPRQWRPRPRCTPPR